MKSADPLDVGPGATCDTPLNGRQYVAVFVLLFEIGNLVVERDDEPIGTGAAGERVGARPLSASQVVLDPPPECPYAEDVASHSRGLPRSGYPATRRGLAVSVSVLTVA